MKQTYYLYNAINRKNKYSVQFINKATNRLNTIHFGQFGASDYTLNKNDNTKRLYRLRHASDNINDLSFSGCWSWHLLWNKKTIEESIKDMMKQFNINIINHSLSVILTKTELEAGAPVPPPVYVVTARMPKPFTKR